MSKNFEIPDFMSLQEDSSTLQRIADRIAASYGEYEEMNNLDGANLPSKAVAEDVASTFLSLIFPGFYSKDDNEKKDADSYIKVKCLDLVNTLEREIEKGVKYNCRQGRVKCEKDNCIQVARMVSLELLDALPGIRNMAHEDAHASFRSDPAAHSLYEVVLSYPGLEALTVHRLAHFLYERGVPFIPRMLNEYIHGKTGIDINPGAKVGCSVSIDHGTGVVIGETAEVGNNVVIYQGVTLGALSVSKEMKTRKRHPTIEDDVTIYAGATILGGETVIGRGSIIGGNVWLVRSLPPGSKVYIDSPSMICKDCNVDFNCNNEPGSDSCPRIQKESP